MGVLERLGHPGPPPGDRLRVGPPGREPHGSRPARCASTSGGCRRSIRASRSAPERAERMAGSFRIWRSVIRPRYGMQSRCRPVAGIGPVRVDRDDMRMLQPRQGLGLSRPGASHLEGDGPVGQVLLLREVDPTERAAAELLDEPVPRDRLPGFRQLGSCRRREREERSGARPIRSWISRTSSNERARSGNLAAYSATSGDSPASSRRQKSSYSKATIASSSSSGKWSRYHSIGRCSRASRRSTRSARRRASSTARTLRSGRPAGNLSAPADIRGTIASRTRIAAPRGRCPGTRPHPRSGPSGSPSSRHPSIRARPLRSSRTRCTVRSLTPIRSPISLQECPAALISRITRRSSGSKSRSRSKVSRACAS